MKNLNFHSILRVILFYSWGALSLSAQTVVSVGSGSYAAQPPSYEYIGNDPSFGTFVDFATNSANIDVDSSKINDPIPTNDWWTSILTQEDGDGNRLGGNLWTYPLMSRFTTSGFEVGNRIGKWSTDELGSRSVIVDYLISLKGETFVPTKAIAMNWSDWHVDLRAQVGDNSTNRIDVTLAQGSPFVWAKTTGFNPVVNAVHAGVRSYYDASGNTLSFPTTTDRFIIEYDDQLYGIHLEQAVTITENTSGLTLSNYEDRWVVFSALNEISELNTLHEYAFVRPIDTELAYDYDPNNGTVTTDYIITTDVITGSQTNSLQGFIPHHYRGNANQFSFLSGLEYVGTPRGTLRLAAGNNLSFEYEFNADILPHFNSPVTDNSDAIPYDDTIMKSMIDGYAADVEFYGIGGGTYWGGKYLLRALKYALMAKETNNENYEYLLSETKEKVYDWLTFTPGETENYYSYYPAWNALIGFNEEYYSAYFTDNHFHYGYLVHCAALLEMAEPGSMDGYWEMITQIIKTYANWDKNDTDYPYLRTFSPWMGHSFANGLGNSIGNNQESSSEAMQSWAGMFMTAEITENTNMRDAAAFGYLMESRAIADYWYNESGVFDEIGYDRPITGILEMNRYVYGTFFGAQETYIHGIQWLPISPAYGFWNDFLTQSEAAAIVDPIMNNMANDLENGISADWMNVSMGFKLFFDPEAVVNQFDGYWNADSGSNEYAVAHNNGENGLTYYYAHASQNIGVRQSNYRLSLPLSSAFLKDDEMTYVVYNPSDSEETCNVYENGNLVTSFDVPGNSLITYSGDEIITTPPTSSFFTPDPNKTYYIDAPYHNLRLAASGNSEEPYTTNTNTTGEDVEWVFIDKGNGAWHVQLAAGGTLPRLRTDNTEFADMQGTAWSGSYTYFEFEEGYIDESYFMTLIDGPTSYNRLQVNNSGQIKFVSTASNQTWESFTFTEVSETSTPTDTSIFIEAEDYSTMSGIQTQDTTDEGGGQNVGWIDTNDWLEYTINVAEAGAYTLNLRIATPNAGVNIEAAGTNTNSIEIPYTGGWQNWDTISSTIDLAAGTQTIRITSTGNGFNINWLEIENNNTSAKEISDDAFAQIVLYPNPVVDLLTINVGDINIVDSVDIISINGQIIEELAVKDTNTISFDSSNLAKGIYLVNLKSDNNILFIKKFIK